MVPDAPQGVRSARPHGLSRRRVLRCALAVPAAVCAGGWAGLAAAATPPPEVAASLPGARLQGTAQMRFLGMHIYDARLWVGEQPVQADWAAVPHALEVIYARGLQGRQIAERSLKEMRRQGHIAPDVAQRWRETLAGMIPDVTAGDRLTAVLTPGQGLRLLGNGQPRAEVPEPDFARRFLGIWLAPQTSEPALRKALLGAGAP